MAAQLIGYPFQGESLDVIKLLNAKKTGIPLKEDPCIPKFIHNTPPWHYIQQNSIPGITKTEEFVYLSLKNVIAHEYDGSTLNLERESFRGFNQMLKWKEIDYIEDEPVFDPDTLKIVGCVKHFELVFAPPGEDEIPAHWFMRQFSSPPIRRVLTICLIKRESVQLTIAREQLDQLQQQVKFLVVDSAKAVNRGELVTQDADAVLAAAKLSLSQAIEAVDLENMLIEFANEADYDRLIEPERKLALEGLLVLQQFRDEAISDLPLLAIEDRGVIEAGSYDEDALLIGNLREIEAADGEWDANE